MLCDMKNVRRAFFFRFFFLPFLFHKVLSLEMGVKG